MLTNQRIETVQALRGVCAFGVMLWHSMLFTGGYDSEMAIRAFRPASIMGVDMFFLICGFVIFLSSTKGKPDDLQTQNPLNFLVRRLVRIYPLYLICTLVIFGIEFNGERQTGELLFRSLFFMPTLNATGPNIFEPALTVGWSITYEVAFYSVFALSLAFGKYLLRVILIWALIALIGMALLEGNYWLDPTVVPPDWSAARAIFLNPINSLFLIGILTGVLYRSDVHFGSATSAMLAVAFSFTCCVAQYMSNWNIAHGMTGVGLPLAALFVSLVMAEKTLRFVVPDVLVRLGNISYSLYLIHPIAIWIAIWINVDFNLGNPFSGWLLVAVTVVLSLGLSVMTYAFIEKAFGSWATRWCQHATDWVLESCAQQISGWMPQRLR
nr:acyltransferase [Rhizobium sp. Root149]